MTCNCPAQHIDHPSVEHAVGCPEHEFPLTQAEIRQVRLILKAVDDAAALAAQYVVTTLFAALGMIPQVGYPYSAPETTDGS